MRFLCYANTWLSEKKEEKLNAQKMKIIHKAKLEPVYIIEASSINNVIQIGLFKYIRNVRIFKLANIVFKPHINNQPLLRNMAVGWGSRVACPGAAEKAITVGSIDPDGKLAINSGKGLPGFNKPNLLAPGTGTIGNKHFSGTSFATPIITGVLASLFSAKDIDKSKIITCLYQTCQSMGIDKHQQGFGVINLEKLMEVYKNEKTILSSS